MTNKITATTESAALIAKVEKMKDDALAQSQAKRTQQLPIWHEETRGLPNSLARGALFTAAKSGGSEKRAFFEGKQIATLGDVRIEYHGAELRQDDASVFMTLLHIGRHQALGNAIRFTAFAMLKELGWSINDREYEHLRRCCQRLSATTVTVSAPDGSGYSGSLIRGFKWKDSGGLKLSQWLVLLEPEIAALFAVNTFSVLDWSERKRIGGRAPLCLWLHSFLCTHRKVLPLSVTKYHELSASECKDLSNFRSRLKQALLKLKEIGFIQNFEVKNDLVHIERAQRKMPAPLLPTDEIEMAA